MSANKYSEGKGPLYKWTWQNITGVGNEWTLDDK